MAVLRPRTRVVFFRVSQREFQEFMQACESSGARSASDFVRLAIQRMIATKPEPALPASAPRQGSNVDALLEHLATRLDQLNETIREHFGKEDSPRASRDANNGRPAHEDGAFATTSVCTAAPTAGSSSHGGAVSDPNAEELGVRPCAI